MTAAIATPVHISRQLAASPEVAFDAWLDPAVIRRWMFKSRTNEIRDVMIDPRVGGSFSISEFDDGEELEHFGTYLEIDRPRRLVFTLQVPTHFPGVSRVTVEIAPGRDGCLLTLTQTGVKREVTEGNWHDMLRTLAALLELGR
jgi:uncharacterized protein YndB with AHSA1/START domain